MIVIILMAGQSKRFKDAGYKTNKAVLPTPSGTVFQDLVDTFVNHVNLVVTVGSNKDTDEVLPHIVSGMPNNLNFDPIWLRGERTSGPIDTIVKAIPSLIRYCNQPCFVSYCDVITRNLVEDFKMHMTISHAQTGFVAFPSTDPRYGYWDGKKVVEKKVISDLAVSGLFYFNTVNVLLERSREVNGKEIGIPSALVEPKFYVAKPEQIIDIGVPEDYERYVRMQR